jgi:hypothetical protein
MIPCTYILCILFDSAVYTSDINLKRRMVRCLMKEGTDCRRIWKEVVVTEFFVEELRKTTKI